jgi:hypothetical protein
VATEANMPMFRAVNPDDELLRKKPVVAPVKDAKN